MALSEIRLFILVIVPLFSLGGLAAFLPRFKPIQATHLSLFFAVLGGVAAALAGFYFWRRPMPSAEMLVEVGPLVGKLPPLALGLYVDRLAAFFLVLTGGMAAIVGLYSFGWLQDVPQRRRIAGVYNLFVLSTLLLIVADNAFFFLLSLECMTLFFSYLVLYKHDKLLEQEETPAEEMHGAKAAFKTYLIASHIGVIFVTASFIALAIRAGSFSFTVFRGLDQVGSPGLAGLIFILALIGFGIKAGLMPAHVWVAVVHPYSPTTTHALTLGLLIKVVSVYPMLRVFFEFLRPVSWWWGWLVLLLAGLTVSVGVFYAIASRDLKSALANHSVENIGIILAGIGLGLVFAADEFSATPAISGLAGLALVAGLYHTLNHAIFKGLLYLCTGAIENRTGSVEMEKLGGLMKRFPWTSITFLIGAASIAGFPPFNGFISEWLTLQTLFSGLGLLGVTHGLPALIGLLLTLLLLSIAFGLTALAFVKIAGETLLGAPRRAGVLAQEKKGEVPWTMRGALVLMAGLCLLLGLFPSLGVNYLGETVCSLRRFETDCGPQLVQATRQRLPFATTTSTAVGIEVPLAPDREGTLGGYSARLSVLPLLIPAAIAAGGAVILVAVRRRKGRPETGAGWTCGTAYDPEAMQITGGAFSFLIWEPVEGTRATRLKQEDASSSHEPLPSRLPQSAEHYVTEFFRWMYDVILKVLVQGSGYVGNSIQVGDVRRYLIYILIAFLVVLAILARS